MRVSAATGPTSSVSLRKKAISHRPEQHTQSHTLGEALWNLGSLIHFAEPIVLVEKPVEPVRELWRGLGRSLEQWPGGGVLVPRGFMEGWDQARRDQEMKQGRIKVVAISTRRDKRRLLAALVNVQPRNSESLRRFYEDWGPLGVGCPGLHAYEEGLRQAGYPIQALDGVALARKWLVRLQEVVRASTVEERRRAWSELAKQVTSVPMLALVSMDFTPAGPVLTLIGLSLLRIILIELTRRSLEENPGTIRRCAECDRPLVAATIKQRFCPGLVCRNRYYVRQAKLKARVLRRLGNGESEKAVVKRFQPSLSRFHRSPLTLVQRWQRDKRRIPSDD
jgi:hypothetical protein